MEGFDLKCVLVFLSFPFATTKPSCLHTRAAPGHFSLQRSSLNGALAACYTWQPLAAVESLVFLQEGKTW